MNCPTCGLNLQGVTAATCPRCGQAIAPASPYSQPPAGYPSTPPGYNAPGAMGYQQPGYEQPAGYGQPSGYGQPGYGQPAGYGMPVPPPPPPAPKRGRFGGRVRLVVMFVVFACIGASLLINALTNKVSQTPLPSVTATVTGKLVYRQTFTSSTDSIATDTNCSFANGGFQVADGLNCYTNVGDQSNATITVQMKQTSGDPSNYCGIDFRHTSKGNFYTFRIDSSGDWGAGKFVNSNPSAFGSASGQSQALQKGMNAVNTLQVRMNGSHFDFVVNGVTVSSADDSTFAKGKVGLGADSSTTCVFNNMEITNP